MINHKWTFKARLRTGIFPWNGTAKASQRMLEAVSEIKKVAKIDSSLAADGVLELFARIYPACMHIDSSSGALGTAVNKTIETLLPVIITADWDIDTRRKKLEELYQAVIDDGWNLLHPVEECWGKLCVSPQLADEWIERLYKHVENAWSNKEYFDGTDICLSCLVFVGRYDDLERLISISTKKSWHYCKYWAEALGKQGKVNQAIEVAESCVKDFEFDMGKYEIFDFCEELLLSTGRNEEAYAKYALKVPHYAVYSNIFKRLCKKYPQKAKREILLDLINQTGSPEKWFASAKSVGELDIALQCAESGNCDISVLLRATRDFGKSNPEFACKVGIEALTSLLTKEFYDRIEPTDIKIAYGNISTIAKDADIEDWFRQTITQRILNIQPKIKSYLIDSISGLIKSFLR